MPYQRAVGADHVPLEISNKIAPVPPFVEPIGNHANLADGLYALSPISSPMDIPEYPDRVCIPIHRQGNHALLGTTKDPGVPVCDAISAINTRSRCIFPSVGFG